MRKWIIALTLALVAAATAAVALASPSRQSPTPEPAGTAAQSAVDASSAVTESTIITDAAYVSLDLAAGFALDPFLVSVNGGGPVDASTLDEACTGFISQAPVVSLDWTGDADFARIFYFSDHDPSLVIQLPDGSYACNNNAHRLLLDPSVDLSQPAQGNYRIWVGNEDGQGLIPGVLVITTKQKYSAGSFQLQGLVKRPPVLEEPLAALDYLPEGDELKALLGGLLEAEEDLPVLEAGTDLTASVEVTGIIPGFVWPVSQDSPDLLCSGVSARQTQLDFTVTEGTKSMRIFFDGPADGGLVVFTPAGDALCQDDSEEGANRNPVLDIENPAPGNYAIMISRIADVDVLTGTVTVTTDMERTPSMLEPAAPPAASN